MIAFFDTNIYIDFLRGRFSKNIYDGYFAEYIIRLCPVVYQELIRCIRSADFRKRVEAAVRGVRFLDPPTTKMWTAAGEMAAEVLGNHDERSLERVQNDLLIALTAREAGALLVTRDKLFREIRKRIPFRMILVE